MEVMLRCAVRDRPGTLAALAGAIGGAGGDIQAIDVVDHGDAREGWALDDLVVVVDSSGLRAVLDAVANVDGVEVVHTGPSRGDPGDAVSRLAHGMETLLTGAMDPERALRTLVGGAVRATSAEIAASDGAPPPDETTMVLEVAWRGSTDPEATAPSGPRSLVVRRDYPFTPVEHERAATILRACTVAAARTASPAP
jgi:hypothetical protein